MVPEDRGPGPGCRLPLLALARRAQAADVRDDLPRVLRDYIDARIFRGLPVGVQQSVVPLPFQLQGEAITWTADGRALLVERLRQISSKRGRKKNSGAEGNTTTSTGA